MSELDDTVIVSPVRIRRDAEANDDTVLVPRDGRRGAQTDALEASDRADAGEDAPAETAPRRRRGIRIGTSEFPLDAPAFIGRHPSTPRIPGRHAYRLVRVPSPSREISSTHVEIRQVGETVVVRDLDSTNGTVVTLPGREPTALRPGDSVALTAGSVVDIGDGIRIEILPERTLS